MIKTPVPKTGKGKGVLATTKPTSKSKPSTANSSGRRDRALRSDRSKKIVSQVNYNKKVLQIIFHEVRSGGRDYITFKDLLQALSAYKIDLNAGRNVSKEDYIAMSKHMFMQICQKAELS